MKRISKKALYIASLFCLLMATIIPMEQNLSLKVTTQCSSQELKDDGDTYPDIHIRPRP